MDLTYRDNRKEQELVAEGFYPYDEYGNIVDFRDLTDVERRDYEF